MLHSPPSILLGIDDLNVRPGDVVARHAVAEKKRDLTHYDPVRVDLAEKANHGSVIPRVILWHSLTV
jgi:hypothetical protein